MNASSYLFSIFILISACTESDTNHNSNINEKIGQRGLETNLSQSIRITDIVGKTLKETEKLLGKATSIEKSKPSGTPCKSNGGCDKAQFQAGKYEILFINNKADWITINKFSGLNLDENSIELIGLPKSIPSFSNASLIRWENLKGIKEISFFNNGSGKIDYIYLKVKTQ